MHKFPYWRIYITANNGDATYTDVNELEFRASVGGADQTSATDNAHYRYVSSANNYSGPAGAFDNNTGTAFLSQAGVPNYVGYCFPEPVEVAQIAVTSPLPGEQTRAPKDFLVQYSAKPSQGWVTALSVTNQTTWTNAETRTFNLPAAVTLAGNITESLDITDWVVRVISCSTGWLIGEQAVSGSSYSISLYTVEPCLITIAPKIDHVWSASKVIALNEYCVPVAPDTTQRLYKATDIGSAPHATGGSEPTWPASGTVADGDITWTFIAALVDPVTIGPKIPS
jgi:hypothetical protein